MTNRELILKAMPMHNLTNSQWNAVQKLAEQTKDSVSASALKILLCNQSKLEIMCMLFDNCSDILGEESRKDTVELAVVGL